MQFRRIMFLSPSSINQHVSNPNTFYITRLVENKSPREPQGEAAALGSSFDLHIKQELIAKNKLSCYENSELATYNIHKRCCTQPWVQNEKFKLSLKDIFMESIDKVNRTSEILTMGSYLAGKYTKDAMPYFEEETKKILGSSFSFYDVELKRVFDLKYKLKGEPYSIPFFGIPDCAVQYDTVTAPLDWKVSGYTSKTGASPVPGYAMGVTNNGTATGPHKKYEKDILMSDISESWADQCCIYGWSMGRPLFKPFYAFIDGLYLRSHSVKIVRYIGLIDMETQANVLLKAHNVWQAVSNPDSAQHKTYCELLGQERLFAESLAFSESWWM